ncbi:MAG: TIR domain-containing protein [Eubacteriales bacterium]
MLYRTRTYIAADWTGDKEIVDKLREWNDSGWYALNFSDAHDLTQSRDTSLPCTIKRSLSERLNGSKTFVLIVGASTKSLTKGACRYCFSYNWGTCSRYYNVDNRSYIEYECEKQ